MTPEARTSNAITPAALTATFAGAMLAVLLTPTWVPALASSLSGAEPKAFWYLSRASGLTAYALLFVSVVAGLSMTSRVRARSIAPPVRFALHQQAAWLGLVLAAFHALVLIGDAYLRPSLLAIVVPFGLEHARGWVGLGQIALYAGAIVALSVKVRARIGFRAWRAIHFASFTVYVLALAHGILAGSDAESPWIAAGYVISGAVVALLTTYRVLTARR